MLEMAEFVQKALHTCSDHEHEETDLYCKTCKKPVCVKCVRNEHKEHDWDTIKNVAKSLRTGTKQRKLEVQSFSKSIALGVSEMLDYVSSNSEQDVSLNCSNLEATRKRLVEYVNREIDQMKDKCERNHKVKKQRLKTIRNEMKTKESRMCFLIQEMETGASEFSDFDLIEMHDELQEIMYEIQSLSEIPRDLNDKMVYHQGSSDMSEIIFILGTLGIKQLSMKLVLKCEFKCKESYFRKICPINGDNAWINGGSSLLKLIDSEGNIDKSVDIHNENSDFAVDKNGTIYFTVRREKSIRKSDGTNIEEFFLTDPYVPESICLSQSGDLIVVLTARKDLPNNPSTIQHVMRRISKTGVMMKHFDLEIDTHKPLVPLIWRILENQNGNVCYSILYTSDNSPGFSIIHCIDCSGNIVFTYGGIKNQFVSLSICNDMRGNILLPDATRKRIHIIDSKGEFICYLFLDESFKHELNSIALLGDTLWLGTACCDSGVIQLYKYYD